MTKTEFLKAIKYQNNEVRRVGISNIAKVNWLNKPWLIIEDNETFEDAKKDDFIPIDSFSSADDLYNTYKNII